MLNPSMFMKLAQSNSSSNKKIEIQKLSGIQRTRWDESIEVPPILYQKFKIQPPSVNIQSSRQVNNTYPTSLIDFIGRCYNRCKETHQKKAMQTQLREIIQKHRSEISSINWDQYAVPILKNIEEPSLIQKAPQQYTNSSYTMMGFGPQSTTQRNIQRQPVMIASSVSNQRELEQLTKQSKQTQSNTKQIINKRLEKLKQKYEQEQSVAQTQPVNNVQQKSFIGFKDQRQVRLQMHKQRYEQMTQKNNIATQIQQSQKVSSNPLSKPSNKIQQSLQVVESRLPQKVYEVKPLLQTLKKQAQQKKQSTSQITKQELQSIVRAGKEEDLKTVAKRFTQFNRVKPVKHVQVQQEADEQDLDFKIVGKCTKIDKPYLRITHRPDPQTVRPEAILRKAFMHYKSEYKKNVPYDTIISQFKSIRQDLTVQNIRNSFTVQVYEQNFRMSIFQDDTIQMKQCQTNLWQLYRQGLYNKRSDRTKFVCYHFICMILQQRYKELQYMLTQIPAQILQEKHVQQSLRLKRFLVIGNYHAFFTFYNSQDETCQKLMNHYIDKVRVKFLVMACKTFGEKINFKLLGMNCAQDEDVLEALAKQQGATVNEGVIFLKESYQKLKSSDFLQVKKVTSLLD